ncbi:YbjN domain-containing protein [Stenotrophomonas sp. YIM B06876]|uniref:YbjN domain-containing protein n=1 Tax=Stenotrophomonas sp. YIM B06876 TaxID=3060211 RepID=UPI002739F976|nr:YbjN domain-containing protein [Stenotrophomonas sp. YIM B06876]
MKKIALGLALASLWGAAGVASANTPDRVVGRLLDALKYEYEVDEDGDYKLVYAVGEGRTQLVFVRSSVETFGNHHIREVWSPAYRSPGPQFPAPVANRLLEDANTSKLGGWVKQGETAMFVVKIDADASAEVLSDAIDAAIRSADAMELELTSKDEF